MAGADERDGAPRPPAGVEGAARAGEPEGGPTKEEAKAERRRTCGIVSACLGVAAALTFLALSSCLSFLTTCDANPGRMWSRDAKLADARSRAVAYWQSKYGEPASPSWANFPNYYGGWAASPDEDEVVVNMGADGTYDHLVFLDLKSGLVADNRQGAEVRQALDAYVKGRLSDVADGSSGALEWATAKSNLANMPTPLEPLTDWEWELAQTPDSLLSDYYGMTREEADALSMQRQQEQLEKDRAAVQPITFNHTHLSADNALTLPDDAPEAWHEFYTTRFDGDVEAFAAAERKAGRLSMDGSDTVYLAVSGEAVLPTGLTAKGPWPAWKQAADEAQAWLDETFSEHPGMLALPTRYARHANDDVVYRRASYPARRQDEDGTTDYSEQPVIDNWVYVDGSRTMRVESNAPGVMLEEGDVSVRESAAGQDAINDAAARADDDRTLQVRGAVYELAFSERVRGLAKLPADADSYDHALPLRMAYYEPDLDYDFGEGQSDPPSTVRNWYLYAFETLGVDEDGTIRNTGETTADGSSLDYAPSPVATFDGWPVEWGLRSPEHTLLLFVAKANG